MVILGKFNAMVKETLEELFRSLWVQFQVRRCG
jgi:hypothetical protein